MNKQLKINNNQELELYLTSFTNMVNRYCAHPDINYAKLIDTAYFGFFYKVPSYPKTQYTHEQEQTNAIKTKFNHVYGRFLDKKEKT